MNENDRHEAFEATVQGELYREVVDIYAEPENFPREEASPFAERMLQLIDKAVAARDAEIREALEAEYERVKKENTGLMGGYDLHTAGTMAGLSFAIGLAEEGTAER